MKYRAKTKTNFWVFGEKENKEFKELEEEKIITETICENTDFKDCYGNEIYEFDILKLEVFGVNHSNRFYVRKISNDFFLCSMINNEKLEISDAFLKAEYLIVGNTFDGIYDFDK